MDINIALYSMIIYCNIQTLFSS